MRDRIILLSIVVAVAMGLKAIDDYVTGPEVIWLLVVATALMACHSVWLLQAQRKWRKKWRKAGLAKTPEGNYSLPHTDEDAEKWEPWVDIFIAEKNESRVIETTVRNFFKLDYEKFYLWVIDDISTDESPAILERLQGEFPRLRVVKRTEGSYPGKSAALNEALPLSKGEVVAVFDADAYVAPNFLKLALPVLWSEGVGAVQVQKRFYEDQSGLLVSCQDAEYAMDTYFQMGRDLIGGTVELRGNGQLIKRAALVDVGGWNNKTLTDDLDLSTRLLVTRWDIRFCPHAYVWEEGVTTVKGLLKQRRRWAEGSIRRYLDYIFPLNSPTRLSLIERIDTLAFTIYFLVPALLLADVTTELIHLVNGSPTYGRFLALATMAVMFVTQIDCFIACRIYRSKMSPLRAFLQSFVVTAYIYLHWVPVIVQSFCQIIFGKGHSKWHRTEHLGTELRTG